MAVAKKKRLFRLASEINIGKETILSFLQNKGFDIENKPTAILDEEMVNLVHEKFKRELRAAEVQREKIEKHKGTKKVVTSKNTDDSPIKDKSQSYKVDQPVEDILKEKHSEELEKAQNLDQPINEEQETDDGLPKIGQVIELPEDLNRRRGKKKKKPTENKKQVTVEKEVQPPQEVKAVKEKIEINDKVDKVEPNTKKEVSKVQTKEVSTKIVDQNEENKDIKKVEEVKVEKPKTTPKEEPKIDQKVEEKIENQQSDKKIDQQPEKSEKIEAKKTEVKADSIEADEDTQAPQLKGLTVLGKIEVEKAKSKKPKPRRKGKPGEKEEEDEIKVIKSKPKKRKRKDKKVSLDEVQTEKTPKAPVTPQEAPKAKDDKRKRKRKKSIREQISKEEVDKAIKETLSGMDGGSSSSRAKLRQKKKQEREEKELKIQEEQEKVSKVLQLTEYVTTSDLANMMDITPNDIILKCMELGLMVTINQRLDKDTLTLISDDYGFDVDFVDEKEINLIEDEEDAPEDLKQRSPIVTIMGHVDHGKTSLLDHIRKANVVSGEAGGITQHIGAYRVAMPDDKSITFLDTPGHEAFTAMRARGAQVTDIVVLVVAADDSVMPQTIEAISHANAAEVPIVVAINKIDKPDANPDRIKQQLSDHGILVEDWGGKYQSIELSAKKGINIDVLLEKILLEAELLDLKANPNRKARGIVVESNMTKGLGSTATIIVQKGTLKIGDPFVSGVYSGRVRVMMDEFGDKIEEASPSDPVLVIGFEGLPEAGDNFVITDSDNEARDIATQRKQLKREQELRQVRHMTLDQISAQIQIGGVQELYLVIKADVAGSAEALSDALLKLSTDEVKVNILHKGVGAITETDVMLAAASQAVIIGFNVSPSGQSRKLAEKEYVDIRKYDIIYDCINEVQLALEGLLTPEQKEEITSEVEVRETFKISKVGTIAGCYVQSGKVTRNDKVRLIRDGLKVYTGTIASLKRGKDDVKEVDQKFECGIQLESFNDVKVGDIIESYRIVEIKRTLT